MGTWKKICCAIDFSDASHLALEKAADLAKELHADPGVPPDRGMNL